MITEKKMKPTISAKKIEDDYGLSPQSMVMLVRNGEFSIYDKFDRKIDTQKHQNNVEELVLDYTPFDLTKTNEETWNEYLDAFAFNNETASKTTQMSYENERMMEALLEIEYELIINNYYFDTEIKVILARLSEESQVPANTQYEDWTQLSAAERNIVLTAWEHVVDTHKPRYGKDALPKRMKILLQKLRGVHFSKLEEAFDGTNISNALRDAKTKDVPDLLKIYHTLPPLPLDF